MRPTKRFFYALTAVSITVLVVAISATLLSNAFASTKQTLAPKINADTHSLVAHRAIIEQLLLAGETSGGYIATTLHQATITSEDDGDVFIESSPYIGEVTALSGARYQVELELLTAGDEVIPLFTSLTLIEEIEQ